MNLIQLCSELSRTTRDLETAVGDRRRGISDQELELFLPQLQRESAALTGIVERLRIEYQVREISKAFKGAATDD